MKAHRFKNKAFFHLMLQYFIIEEIVLYPTNMKYYNVMVKMLEISKYATKTSSIAIHFTQITITGFNMRFHARLLECPDRLHIYRRKFIVKEPVAKLSYMCINKLIKCDLIYFIKKKKNLAYKYFIVFYMECLLKFLLIQILVS